MLFPLFYNWKAVVSWQKKKKKRIVWQQRWKKEKESVGGQRLKKNRAVYNGYNVSSITSACWDCLQGLQGSGVSLFLVCTTATFVFSNRSCSYSLRCCSSLEKEKKIKIPHRRANLAIWPAPAGEWPQIRHPWIIKDCWLINSIISSHRCEIIP